MRVFTDEPMVEILAYLANATDLAVLDPDRGRGLYAGEIVEIDGVRFVHRPLRTWLELAERLQLRLATPRVRDHLIELRFEPLGDRLRPRAEDPTEKYGADTEYARVNKLEDPRFVLDLREALARAALPDAARVLDLGVNTGDELALLPGAAITGVDHSASALAVARTRYPHATFVEADLRAPLPFRGRFDLILSIHTFQSGAIDDRDLLRRLVQDHLAPDGAIIIGLPNCRYVDGELEYGARIVNLSQPELGLLVKDVAFYRKYLQQHHRQVFVTGKHHVLVTGVATRESRAPRPPA